MNVGELQKWLATTQPIGEGVKIVVIDRASGKIITEKEPAPAAKAPEGAPLQVEFQLTGKDGSFVLVPKEKPKEPMPPPAGPMGPGFVIVQAPPSWPAPPQVYGQGPMGPGFVIVHAPGQKPAPGDTDKRLDALEQKLKSILDEVEQLRREQKPGAPQGEATPMDKVPDVVRFFKDDGVATVRNLRFKVLELKETADAEKAKGEALLEQAKAEVAAAEAGLNQAQAALDAAAARKAPAADLQQAKAEVDVRRAAVVVAQANLNKAAQDQRAMEVEIEAKLRDAEAGRQAAEDRVKLLELELEKAKEAAAGDAPKKP